MTLSDEEIDALRKAVWMDRFSMTVGAETTERAWAAVNTVLYEIAKSERMLARRVWRKCRERTLEEAAVYIEARFARCNLIEANGYLNGDDVAANIRALRARNE